MVKTISLLFLSNIFMTYAWYGHLKTLGTKPLWIAVIVSWGVAFFEYCFQVPANKLGYEGNGGPFTLLQLKVIQEVITLVVFVLFSMLFFKNEQLRWNHFVGFTFLILAVYFIFKK